jgi:hypothetical protein
MKKFSDRHLVGAGVAACTVCCAPPFLGLLGIVGIGATAATFAIAGMSFALVVGMATLFAVVRRQRVYVRK